MLSLFDESTVSARPWADAGYTCYCVDLAHPRGETRNGNIIRVGRDIRDWLPPRDVAFVAAFPPCTDLAVSGARHFRDKGLGALLRAVELFKRTVDLCEMLGAPYYIENPASMISSYWRKPDYRFDPADYGDPWTKATFLWTGNGFVMPDKQPWPQDVDTRRIHWAPPSKERAAFRSQTPPGWARAVFQANAREAVR